jgi:hypothetical protein
MIPTTTLGRLSKTMALPTIELSAPKRLRHSA